MKRENRTGIGASVGQVSSATHVLGDGYRWREYTQRRLIVPSRIHVLPFGGSRPLLSAEQGRDVELGTLGRPSNILIPGWAWSKLE